MYPLLFKDSRSRRLVSRDEERLRAVFNSIADFVVHESTAFETADSLVRTGAYRVNLDSPRPQWYTWHSGIVAPCYCDCRTLCGHPKDRMRISAALAKAVRMRFPQADLIVGMGLAGITWAEAVAGELKLPLAYIRTHKKEYGMGGLVECSPERSHAAIIIDDLVAGGESVKHAVQTLVAEKQIVTLGVQSIVNWGFPQMRSNLAGVSFRALTSFPHILMRALSRALISEHDFVHLLGFYQNPTSYDWNGVKEHQKVETLLQENHK